MSTDHITPPAPTYAFPISVDDADVIASALFDYAESFRGSPVPQTRDAALRAASLLADLLDRFPSLTTDR